jgi:biuret amidohydrolase
VIAPPFGGRVVAGTRPYPWPFDGLLDPARLALVVAGAQGWWADRTVDSEEVLSRLRGVAKVVRDSGGVVVVLRHVLGPPSPGPRQDGPGGALVVSPVPGDLVVACGGMSGFSASRLDGQLRRRGIDRLAVGGLGMETAVYSTLGAANDRGYECLALADGSAFHDPAVGARALSSITMSGGIFAAVGTTTALCDALLEEHP